MLLIEGWLRRDLNIRVHPVLSLVILVTSPSESLRCMFRDLQKSFYGNAQALKINLKKKNLPKPAYSTPSVSKISLQSLRDAISDSTKVTHGV